MKNENDAEILLNMSYVKLINAIFGIKNMAEEAMDDLDPVEDTIRWEHLVSEINEILSAMTKQEQQVLAMRFGLGAWSSHTYEQVARKLNMTKENVKDIEAIALRKLRHPRRSRVIKEIMDNRASKGLVEDNV